MPHGGGGAGDPAQWRDGALPEVHAASGPVLPVDSGVHGADQGRGGGVSAVRRDGAHGAGFEVQVLGLSADPGALRCRGGAVFAVAVGGPGGGGASRAGAGDAGGGARGVGGGRLARHSGAGGRNSTSESAAAVSELEVLGRLVVAKAVRDRADGVGVAEGSLKSLLGGLVGASKKPASRMEKLQIYSQRTAWDKHDRKMQLALNRDDLDSESDVKALRRTGRRRMREYEDELDPDGTATRAVVGNLRKAPGVARKTRELHTYEYAQGICRRMLTTDFSRPADVEALKALAARGNARFRYAQLRLLLVRSKVFSIEAIEAAEAEDLAETEFEKQSHQLKSSDELKAERAKRKLAAMKKVQGEADKRVAKKAKDAKSEVSRLMAKVSKLESAMRAGSPTSGTPSRVTPSAPPRPDCPFCSSCGLQTAKFHGVHNCFYLRPNHPKKPAHFKPDPAIEAKSVEWLKVPANKKLAGL